jgi:uncharacterized cupredoxin-like copper-binding protein
MCIEAQGWSLTRRTGVIRLACVLRIILYADPISTRRRLRTMKSTLKGTLTVMALTLVLALVLTSCGGGAGGGGAGGGSSASSKAASSTKAATGGSSGQATTEKNVASGGAIKTVVIKESEFKLSPSTVTLSKPGTYAFKAENEGSYQHSLEIEGKGVKSKEGEEGEAKLEQVLNPGQSGVLTVSFQKPGTYEMYCPVDGHEQEGMKGEVVVK